jgi:hypothetical protein
MPDQPDPPPPLAPLQEIMLRDSLAAPDAGYHVEQVEIVLARDFSEEQVSTAWRDTVKAADALRTAFKFEYGIPAGAFLTSFFPEMEIQENSPSSWETWREEDRLRKILVPGKIPWRMTFWPRDYLMIWTFHHALLDGRSIARILNGFLTRLGGGNANHLPSSIWHPPSGEAIAAAATIFQQMPRSVTADSFPASTASGPAIRNLGEGFALRLETHATKQQASLATLVTWAWGQAMAGFFGIDQVLVEQLRSGAPQLETAGFTMNVLPIVIERSGPQVLRDFHMRLLALRQIESVSFADLPPGIHPDVDAPGTSMIMVEHGTLQHMVAMPGIAETIMLHERKGESLMATAHLLPNFRLEVEGPHRHNLLERWILTLEGIPI